MIAACRVSGLFRVFLILAGIALVSACSKSEPSAASKAPEQAAAAAGEGQQPWPDCVEAKSGGPEDVVRTLYQQYSIENHKSLLGAPKEELEKYLDTRLVAALMLDRTCEEDSGDVCAIDYDIMYDAQDAEISALRICAMNAKSNTVQVQFVNFNQLQEVTYEMNNTAAGWRITDIGGGMVATLENHYMDLAKAWEKAQGPEQIPASAKNKEPLPHCEPAKTGGPEDLVRSLYEQYPWKGDRIIINEPRDVLEKYFDEPMVKAITENKARRVAAKHLFLRMPNIMINQEMNYVQDISGFRICAMDAAARTINVQFRDAGEPRIITYKLADTAAGPRISGIYYTAGAHPAEPGKGWSLAEALSSN